MPDCAAGLAAPPTFVCTLTQEDAETVWVRVTGELDLLTSEELAVALRDAHRRGRLIVLDLRELTFMDGCGLRVILGAAARAGRRGRRLIVVRGAPTVDRLFALTGAREQVETVDVSDTQLAVRALLQPGALGCTG
jgi:anti-sigma B factor antagonist